MASSPLGCAAALAPTRIAPARLASGTLAVATGATDGAPGGGGATPPAWATAGKISPAVPTSADVTRKWRRAISGCCEDMLILLACLRTCTRHSAGVESKDC